MTEGVLAQLNEGDVAARQEFFSSFFQEVRGICSRILGNDLHATELATDTLTDFLFEHATRISSPAAVQSYLRLMAVRRSLRLRQRLEQQVPVPESLVPERDPHQQAELRLLGPRMNSCLATLSPKAQRALRLRFREDLTFAEIGTLVGGSSQYIGRLVARSLVLLRACLERDGDVKVASLPGGDT